MKKIKIVFITIILIILMLPMLFFNNEKNVKSDIDNRMLTELNDLKSSTIDNYINDRIGFRSELIQTYNYINSKAFNVLTHPDYLYGKNNEIFHEIDGKIIYCDYHKHFLKTIKEIQDYCESRGINFYFVFDPSKTYIYPEKLPKGINIDDKWLEEFVCEAYNLGINTIDNYSNLKEIKNNYRLYNREYDVNHWNDTGAFYGTNKILSTIHNDFDEINKHNENDYSTIVKKEKLIPDSNFEIDEDVVYYEPHVNVVDCSEKYREGLFLYEDFQDFYYYKTSKRLPCILSFQGSYLMGTRSKKFLADNASDFVAIHNYQNIYNIDYYINIFNPDVVVFEVADYVLKEYYFSEYYMDTMNLNPAYQYNDYQQILNNDKTYSASTNGEYTTIMVDCENLNNVHAYLFIDDRICDFITYDNEKKYITLLSEVYNKANHIELRIVNTIDKTIQKVTITDKIENEK